MFSFDEFEDMCEKLAEAWQQILMPFEKEKLSEVLEAIYNDQALWPKRLKSTVNLFRNTPKSHSSNTTTSRLWQKISLISGEHFSKTA